MKATVKVISDSIVSPLGTGSLKNYQGVLHSCSETSLHSDIEGLKDPAMVSMLDRSVIEKACLEEGIPEEFTFFEKIMTLSIKLALKGTDVDTSSERVGFVFSSTKGNVSLLDSRNPLPEGSEDREHRSLLGTSARIVSQYFGNPNTPVTVSNACISGVCAEILASRQIAHGVYDRVIVCGCDVQCLFIISGFQSFKALSEKPCRPFDKDRDGLNLGEAASTVILSNEGEGWSILSGAIRNDANHISGPSRTAEGSYRALASVTGQTSKDEIAFVNVHGTSTPYNDEMESIAIERSRLIGTPVNGLKGNFGHTMGSAGILESIISMKAVENGTVLGTKGYGELGVTYPVSVSAEARQTSAKSFVKLLSGFGGCNAAALFSLDRDGFEYAQIPSTLKTLRTVRITPDSVVLDGETLACEGKGRELLDNLFRSHIGSYPKYFKMDTLCRLGFVASELLLKDDPDRFTPREDRAVVLFNSSSSLCNDREYQRTIQDPENYYPSPSLFVYTLANIVTGEISIRNKYLGETSFYVLDRKDEAVISRTILETFMDPMTRSAVTGWLECRSDDDFLAEISIVER